MNERGRWREVLLYQAWCHLRLESERLWVGYLWWPLETFFEMGLLYAVFHGMLGTGTPHYLSFLLCGLVAWRWLAQGVTRAAPSILQNQPLATQVFVPKLLFPAAILLADAVRAGVGIAVLLVFLRLDGLAPLGALAGFVPVLGTHFLFVAALGLWAAALVPFLRSLLVGLDVGLRFAMLGSGVFFDLSRVGGTAGSLLAWNPAALLLGQWRTVLVDGRAPDPATLAAISAGSLLAIAGAHAFVSRRELLYPRLPA